MDALKQNPFPQKGASILFLVLLSINCYSQIYINASANLPNDGASGQTVDLRSCDIDLDGDKDIILANEYQVNSILINNGTGFFTYDNTLLDAAVHDSEDIAVADFDLDGDLDILFVSEDDFEHEFFLNDGNGGFTLTPFYPFSASNSVAVDDFNNDGFPDLFIGNLGQNFMLINTGFATFENETPNRLPWIEDNTYDVKIVDVNNDGNKDIIVGNSDGNKILINQGAGYFEDESNTRFPTMPQMDTRKVVVGDVNADGAADLLLCNVEFSSGNDPQNRILINDGNGFFSDLTQDNIPAFSDQTMDGVFMDFDDDGDEDILVTNVLHSPLLIYQNNGDGKYTSANNLALGGINFTIEGFGIITDDFNNDGFDDIYICNQLGKDVLLLRDPNIEIVSDHEPYVHEGKLFPNPIESHFTLEKANITGNPSFRILDIKGTEVITLNNYSTSNDTFQFHFERSNIPVGLYYLEIKTKSETFVKELFFKPRN